MREQNIAIGFMQGRLSPIVDGKIQAFPWSCWQDEFALAAGIGLTCMEWTLDQDRIFENPLMTEAGRAEIRGLSARHGIGIPSLTGDCFMQAPFWKTNGRDRAELVAVFEKVLLACADLGISAVVVPLVDNGALTSESERAALEDVLLDFRPLLVRHGLFVAFESDFPPDRLAAFIAGFPADSFGINFDMGNSASLGWDPDVEIGALAPRIVNVHVKDRVLGGTTVPLGEGAADFSRIFPALRRADYRGNYILQTARAADGGHGDALRRYKEFVVEQVGGSHGS